MIEPQHKQTVMDVFAKWGVEAAVVGRVPMMDLPGV